MLRQIIINIGHCKNGLIPQFLAITILDVVIVQLLVAKMPGSIKAGTILWMWQTLKSTGNAKSSSYVETIRD